jgi:hypothetical protein
MPGASGITTPARFSINDASVALQFAIKGKILTRLWGDLLPIFPAASDVS